MHPEINPEITKDALLAAPVPHKGPEPPASSITLKADMPSPTALPGDESPSCEDPDCPFCRWIPIVNEILENLQETDVFNRMVESGYPMGFSLGLLPPRIQETHSVSMEELVDGLEQSLREDKHAVIPASRVADILDTLKAHLEESDDLLTLTIINDKMIATMMQMLAVALDPDAPPASKAEAERWYRNMSGPKPPKN